MSLEFELWLMCTRHIAMDFSGVPKWRMNLTQKLYAWSSNFISSNEISVEMPFKIALRARST